VSYNISPPFQGGVDDIEERNIRRSGYEPCLKKAKCKLQTLFIPIPLPAVAYFLPQFCGTGYFFQIKGEEPSAAVTQLLLIYLFPAF